jgi:putative membrane protein
MDGVDYPGIDGFLGTRASLMLDVLFLAMFAIVVVLGWSVFQVKYRRRFDLHKWAQLALGTILLVTVVAFEVDIRLHGWEDRAAGAIGGHPAMRVFAALYIHLVFAVAAVVLWPVVIVRALRNFPNPPRPAEHSRWHLRWARVAAVDMVLTAITGWVFYILAFVL